MAVSALCGTLASPAFAQSLDLGEIVVSSPWWENAATNHASTANSVTAVSAQETLSKGAASLGDSLGTLPGVSATSFSPVASRPVIRGLGGFRVRTQENGIGSHDMANLGEDHAVTIDPLAAGQIEVIRGPGTLRYGSQAIGGVVSSSNRRIPTAIPENGVAFETRGGFTSVNQGRDGAVALDAGGGNFAIHADAFKRQANDYSTPDGVQKNSSYRADGYSLGGAYLFQDGFIGLSYQSNKMTYFIPGFASAEERNHIDLRQDKWSSRGEWRVGEKGIDTIRYWLGFTDYKHDEINIIDGIKEIGSKFRNKEIESRVEISHLPVATAWGELRGTAGLQWGKRNLSVAGATEELLSPARAQNLAAFVFEELQLTQTLRAQAAIRIEKTNITGTGASFPANYLPPPDEPTLFPVNRDFAPISVSAGLVHELPHDIFARLTVQHVERSPDPIEMFYKGPHDTPRTFEIGDPNMTIEKADTIEIGFKRAKGDTRFEASAYYTKYQNFIYKNFTGILCGDTFESCGQPGATFDQIIYSQRDATFFGGELALEHDVARIGAGVWGVEAQYDFVRATFADGSSVPKIPPHRLGGGAYYRDENWTARVNLLHAFAQNNTGAFETPTAAFNLLNAELAYTTRLPQGHHLREFTVGLKGENLLNERIRLHQSYKKDEVLQPGLNVRLFASAKF
ncbi:MAG TPA: TonB-dependent receptor [Xanthobacteraceae bacterium]|nr:TonB-dependent receptor [Xanthobacteraceae bacterium]